MEVPKNGFLECGDMHCEDTRKGSGYEINVDEGER